MFGEVVSTLAGLFDLMRTIEDVNRRVWGSRTTIAAVAHLLGGLGFGLLAYGVFGRRRASAAYTFLTIGLAIHAYAFVAAIFESGTPEGKERLHEWRSTFIR